MQAVIDQSSPEAQVKQIIQALRALPPEKVTEVWDFVTFLQDHYIGAQPVDVDDSWSDQDLHDIRRASLGRMDAILHLNEV